MKNPFIAAALMMSAMSAAFAENTARSLPNFSAVKFATGRTRIPGRRNPAGSKLARKWAKAAGREWRGERAAS